MGRGLVEARDEAKPCFVGSLSASRAFRKGLAGRGPSWHRPLRKAREALSNPKKVGMGRGLVEARDEAKPCFVGSLSASRAFRKGLAGRGPSWHRPLRKAREALSNPKKVGMGRGLVEARDEVKPCFVGSLSASRAHFFRVYTLEDPNYLFIVYCK
ncbi:hypothetical protein PRIPAC_85464 [Pristionchus pacificus]|uniref:Uncharacterized protein n=1 Tax=Pristionchus pacificus TaxID=54126 RepID=A0A2A6BTJ5_PRIPA|nr:hypothetical protein PRIPAC_85464 [Pristionchus pacificus]|eukprot:PDM69220.1 hypothetical protein PRIPAC_47522 [Pristionchus pacificus]